MKLLILCALAMSVGWGWRGDYGHEAGALIPGALLALAACLGSGREDWLARAPLIGFFGAIGWAIGGQMSYGIVIGYTASSSFKDVFYGYGSLFLIGGLWGGIGAAILAFGLTWKRSELEPGAWPLITIWAIWKIADLTGIDDQLTSRWSLNDTNWTSVTIAILVALAFRTMRPTMQRTCDVILIAGGGWWIGLLVLNILLGLRMTPPRSDNWAGCLGLFVALALYHYYQRNRAATRLALFGLLSGGIGFSVADLFNILGRAKWGWIARSETLQALDSWKWMEQLFGLIMGLGIAICIKRFVDDNLESVSTDDVEDTRRGPLWYGSLIFLFVVMWWENLPRNLTGWLRREPLAEGLFGLSPRGVGFVIAVILSGIIIWAIHRYRTDEVPLIPAESFGRTQFLFLFVLWTALVADFTQALPQMKNRAVLFVHFTFWITALACTAIVAYMRGDEYSSERPARACGDLSWNVGRYYWLSWILVPALLFGLARFSLGSHDQPLHGANQRFEARQ